MKTREYFCTPDGNIAIRIDDQVRNITTDDIDLINDLLIKVETDYPKAYAALESIYGAQAHARWRMFSRFVRCNFGSFDHIDDVDDDYCSVGLLSDRPIPARHQAPQDVEASSGIVAGNN